MLPPRRHRHRIEQCPSCDRVIGEVRPSFGGGKYMIVDPEYWSHYNPQVRKHEIICMCGYHHFWKGKEVKSIDPDQQTA